MKRLFRFLGLALIMLSIFACSLEIPETVEIKGNPKLNFAANMDFGDVFGDMISDGFGKGENKDITVLKAPYSPLDCQTLVIRIPLFNPEIPNPVGQSTITIGGADIIIDPNPAQNVTVSGDKTLIDDSQNFPLTGLFDHLEGFSVDPSGIEAKVFFDGSEVVNNFKIAMSFGAAPPGTAQNISRQSSGIEPGNEEYAGTGLPIGGIDVSGDGNLDGDDGIKDLLKSKGDSKVNYQIDLKGGSTINGNMFVNATISAELVIWFPLVFNASAGAELKMDELNSAGDFISKLAETEVLEDVNVKLTMEGTNPFDGAHLLIKDKGNSNYVLIDNEITDSINFELEKEDIDYINDRDNFESVLSIFFPASGTLKIPKTLKISTISINAKVSVDLLEDD